MFQKGQFRDESQQKLSSEILQEEGEPSIYLEYLFFLFENLVTSSQSILIVDERLDLVLKTCDVDIVFVESLFHRFLLLFKRQNKKLTNWWGQGEMLCGTSHNYKQFLGKF